jgi:5'-3' exonuclease
MGIPSYFSFIIKQHTNIIKKYSKHILKINNLYLDCNSIIYDTFHSLSSSNSIINNEIIIHNVIQKIEYYISIIKPDTNVIIAFDGVAPVAKLEQQRSRRYKTWFQNQIKKNSINLQDIDDLNELIPQNQNENNSKNEWQTSQITPGTPFMKLLDKQIHNYFNTEQYKRKHNISNLFVTGSNIYGEGEHKIFQFIRNNKETHLQQYTFVYGLDADLIMLCINHLNICPNIYLFRETPQFIKSIDSSLEPNENYYLDINELTKNIPLICNSNSTFKIYDYIFICFMLGNDFLPHFPSLNIRTGGIYKLMDIYSKVIAQDETITNGETIHWKNMYKFIKELSTLEQQFMIEEHKLRNKREHYTYPLETPEDRMKYIDSIPTIKRDLEKYINPMKEGWQNRYYKTLFKADKNNIKNICINYLEGLEWTFKYYTNGCYDWRWSYHFHYPPLLTDLVKYIPVFDTQFITYKEPKPVTELVQLCYVLPYSSLNLLPPHIYNFLIHNHKLWYKTNCQFVWAYCRYFWECHVELPEIDIHILEKYIKN